MFCTTCNKIFQAIAVYVRIYVKTYTTIYYSQLAQSGVCHHYIDQLDIHKYFCHIQCSLTVIEKNPVPLKYGRA